MPDGHTPAARTRSSGRMQTRSTRPCWASSAPRDPGSPFILAKRLARGDRGWARQPVGRKSRTGRGGGLGHRAASLVSSGGLDGLEECHSAVPSRPKRKGLREALEQLVSALETRRVKLIRAANVSAAAHRPSLTVTRPVLPWMLVTLLRPGPRAERLSSSKEDYEFSGLFRLLRTRQLTTSDNDRRRHSTYPAIAS